MDNVVKVRQCEWCHEPFHLHDGRYRYCSDECAEAAQLARCQKTCREPEETFKKTNVCVISLNAELRERPPWLTRIINESKLRAKKQRQRLR